MISAGDCSILTNVGRCDPWFVDSVGPFDQANANVKLDTSNVDGPTYVIRYRHYGNTSANVSYLDGHAGPAKIGTLTQRNYACNY